MKKILLPLFGIIALAGAAFAAPKLLPHTTVSMQEPEFWVSRIPSPDALILDEQGVAELNRRVQESGLTVDLLSFPPVKPEDLKRVLEEDWRAQRDATRFDSRGKKAGAEFFRGLRVQLNLGHIPQEVHLRYGFIVRSADQRILPTAEILTAEPGDTAFDELQNSSLDSATPLVIVHESLDGRWLYTQTASSRGWVRRDAVVRCTRAEFRDFLSRPFVVVTRPKARIFRDERGERRYETVRMGVRLPVVGVRGDMTEIMVPFSDEKEAFLPRQAYVRTRDVRQGFLPYTARNVITQAFHLLGTPYGWGGTGGEQDCSSFIQSVFATVGIQLPRNSWEQALAGESVGELAAGSENDVKRAALVRAPAGTTLARLKGHIMLYLGTMDGRFYAIHATHAFREQTAQGERKVVLNRVVVSDFSLGEGTSKGSLLNRLLTLRAVRLPADERPGRKD